MMDMEKGEGPGLEEKFGIKAYPSLLFLNPDGTVKLMAVGYHKPRQFVMLGHKALK